jgi:hypothetical protein
MNYKRFQSSSFVHAAIASGYTAVRGKKTLETQRFLLKWESYLGVSPGGWRCPAEMPQIPFLVWYWFLGFEVASWHVLRGRMAPLTVPCHVHRDSRHEFTRGICTYLDNEWLLHLESVKYRIQGHIAQWQWRQLCFQNTTTPHPTPPNSCHVVTLTAFRYRHHTHRTQCESPVRNTTLRSFGPQGKYYAMASRATAAYMDQPLAINVTVSNLNVNCIQDWLSHCAASRKVAVLIPDGVTGIFH